MTKNNTEHLSFYTLIACLVCLSALLTGCTLPASYDTPAAPDIQNPAYTQAAETIAAQLTQIAAPTSAGDTPAAAGATLPGPQEAPNLTAQPGAPDETLPATSTPLPTKTPLPSDTPTITPTGTNTLTPTVTPVAPTATPTTQDPTNGLGDPDWTDSFSSSGNWPIYTDEHVAMSVGNSRLSMTALKADRRNPYDAWMLSLPVLTNFYLEATVTNGQCTGVDRYGLLGRAPGFNPISAYVFGVSCDGQYSLRIWDGSQYINLITWTYAAAIKQGADQTNVLGLRAEGSRLSLFANNYLLADYEDDTFASGYFGLFVGAANTDGFNIQVSNVSYWELP